MEYKNLRPEVTNVPFWMFEAVKEALYVFVSEEEPTYGPSMDLCGKSFTVNVSDDGTTITITEKEVDMAKPKMKFSHRSGGHYYWTRRLEDGCEEMISCPVLWFWNWTSVDENLPACDCSEKGPYGATGMMPDNNHVVVRTPKRQYLAHKV